MSLQFVKSSTPDPFLMEYLETLFESHGASAETVQDWVTVEGGKLRCQAYQSTIEEAPEGVVLHGEFGIDTMIGAIFREEFIGSGPNRQIALSDICNSFQVSVFHTVFSALLNRDILQADVETWEIDGSLRRVTIGPMGCRGEPPFGDDWPATYDAIEAQIRDSNLDTGIHGIRYHYVHPGDEPPTLQVHLDNCPWPALREEASGFAWPVGGDDCFSIRLFFLIMDIDDDQ